jgi:hypothetical protein
VNGWLVGGLALGVAAIIVYLILVATSGETAELLTGARLFLSAVLVVAGVKLGYLVVSTDENKLGPFKGEDRLYIVIGAIVMMWVACADVYRELSAVGVDEAG